MVTRGSSMGGHYAIHAGAACPTLKAVVAICPSSEAVCSGASSALTQRAIGCGKSLITYLSGATAIQST